MRLVGIVASIATAVLAACFHTQSEVAVKPVDINLNITGRLEVVITDARKQEEEITGQKPKRTVTPEDIGLPAATATTNNPGAMLTDHGWNLAADLLLVTNVYAAGDRNQLIQQMAARHPQIASMLDNGSVGESHTGFLVPKTSLTAAQQALVNAENADRTELYKLEAASKNTSVDQVALAYYMARLEHVNKGTWVERYNKAAGTWEWFQWNR
jgi:uncharacterized protein YdbL (DUF1318 family)